MIIREYQSSDCKELAELFYNTVHTINARDYTKEQLDAWATGTVDLEEWNRTLQEHYCIVVVKNEIIVGFGDIDKTGYLDRLYVHKDYQGKGIATAICDRLEQAVQGKIVTHASITAKRFFEKRGYTVIKEQQVERQGIMLTNFVMERGIGQRDVHFVPNEKPEKKHKRQYKTKCRTLCLIQCTWGILQTFAGFLFFLYYRKEPHDFYRGCIRTRWSLQGGISLGMFIFVERESPDEEALTVHEYGHTYQSLLLGPFYIIPGICSLVWSRSKRCQRMRQEQGISYYSYWTERWADRLGEKATGLPSMGTVCLNKSSRENVH